MKSSSIPILPSNEGTTVVFWVTEVHSDTTRTTHTQHHLSEDAADAFVNDFNRDMEHIGKLSNYQARRAGWVEVPLTTAMYRTKLVPDSRHPYFKAGLYFDDRIIRSSRPVDAPVTV